MQLYKIAHEYEQALTSMQEDETLTPEIVEDSLALIKDDFDNKAINISSFIKNLDAEATAIREAEKEMANRRQRIEKNAENIRKYLLENMEKCEISEIKCPYFKLKIKKCPPSIKIIDESKLRNMYLRIKKEPDKTKIKEALQAGKKVIGAILVKDNRRLEIK